MFCAITSIRAKKKESNLMRSCQKYCLWSHMKSHACCALKILFLHSFALSTSANGLFVYRSLVCLKCSWANVLSLISSGKRRFFVLLLLDYFSPSCFFFLSTRHDNHVAFPVSFCFIESQHHPNHCLPSKMSGEIWFWLLVLLFVVVILCIRILIAFLHLSSQSECSESKTRK